MHFFQVFATSVIGECAVVLLTLVIHNPHRTELAPGGWRGTILQHLNRRVITFFFLQVVFISVPLSVWIAKVLFQPTIESTLYMLDDLREELDAGLIDWPSGEKTPSNDFERTRELKRIATVAARLADESRHEEDEVARDILLYKLGARIIESTLRLADIIKVRSEKAGFRTQLEGDMQIPLQGQFKKSRSSVRELSQAQSTHVRKRREIENGKGEYWTGSLVSYKVASNRLPVYTTFTTTLLDNGSLQVLLQPVPSSLSCPPLRAENSRIMRAIWAGRSGRSNMSRADQPRPFQLYDRLGIKEAKRQPFSQATRLSEIVTNYDIPPTPARSIFKTNAGTDIDSEPTKYLAAQMKRITSLFGPLRGNNALEKEGKSEQSELLDFDDTLDMQEAILNNTNPDPLGEPQKEDLINWKHPLRLQNREKVYVSLDYFRKRSVIY